MIILFFYYFFSFRVLCAHRIISGFREGCEHVDAHRHFIILRVILFNNTFLGIAQSGYHLIVPLHGNRVVGMPPLCLDYLVVEKLQFLELPFDVRHVAKIHHMSGTAVSTARRIDFCFMIYIVKFIIINFKLADVSIEENDAADGRV